MNNEQLRNLIKLMKAGSTEAFEEIYNGLSTPIYTIALKITRNPVLAEEAVQEVFIKLYTSPPDENIEKPRAYIFKSAHNKALDIAKSNPMHEDIDEKTDIPAANSDCGDITKGLNLLPESERIIVTLHINAGLKFREIAEITGSPVGTVLWRYRKAISRLKAFLTD